MDQSKTVGRDDLQASESERSSSPDIQAQDRLRELLSKQFGAVEYEAVPPTVTLVDETAEDPGQDEGLEFRMFNSDVAPRKIIIRESSPSTSAPGFIVPDRPQSYYFAEAPSPALLHQLQQAAVSGQDVLDRSKLPWAGCSYSWKVSIADKGPAEGHNTGKLDSNKRRRPSKKARIALRVKVRAKAAAEEQSRKAAEEKEAYLREKKTAMNRKKQAKKRAKEKLKRTEMGEIEEEGRIEAPD